MMFHLVSISHHSTRSDPPSLGSSTSITVRAIRFLSSASRDQLAYQFTNRPEDPRERRGPQFGPSIEHLANVSRASLLYQLTGVDGVADRTAHNTELHMVILSSTREGLHQRCARARAREGKLLASWRPDLTAALYHGCEDEGTEHCSRKNGERGRWLQEQGGDDVHGRGLLFPAPWMN